MLTVQDVGFIKKRNDDLVAKYIVNSGMFEEVNPGDKERMMGFDSEVERIPYINKALQGCPISNFYSIWLQCNIVLNHNYFITIHHSKSTVLLYTVHQFSHSTTQWFNATTLLRGINNLFLSFMMNT